MPWGILMLTPVCSIALLQSHKNKWFDHVLTGMHLALPTYTILIPDGSVIIQWIPAVTCSDNITMHTHLISWLSPDECDAITCILNIDTKELCQPSSGISLWKDFTLCSLVPWDNCYILSNSDHVLIYRLSNEKFLREWLNPGAEHDRVMWGVCGLKHLRKYCTVPNMLPNMTQSEIFRKVHYSLMMEGYRAHHNIFHPHSDIDLPFWACKQTQAMFFTEDHFKPKCGAITGCPC